MKEKIAGLMDKVLTKGMSLMESERMQKIMASEQAQKALDLGLSALTKVQEISDSAKAGIARKMGLATQKEVDALREELEAKLAASEKAE
ncbi:MAG: hypothetical protein ACI4VB_03720 [Bradymonadia bacterium]